MPRDAYASLRLPPDLKDRVQEIANAEQRSLSNTIELLLSRGARAYKRDGVLVEPRRAAKGAGHSAQPTGTAEEEEFAERIASRIVEKVLERIESEGKDDDGKHHAAA